MTLCHLKRLCRTTMAANGGSMGRSKSTTPNTQGEFLSFLIRKMHISWLFFHFLLLKTPLYYQAIMPHVVPMMLSKLGGRNLVWDDKGGMVLNSRPA